MIQITFFNNSVTVLLLLLYIFNYYVTFLCIAIRTCNLLFIVDIVTMAMIQWIN